MMKKIMIFAVIALILVPASVMAAGLGGKSAGAVSGQGLCLQDRQDCMNQTGQPGTGTQAQYRYSAQQNGMTGAKGAQGLCLQDGQTCGNQTGQQGTGIQAQYRYNAQQNGMTGAKGAQGPGYGQCDGSQNQTRSMLRLHDGSGGACKSTT